MKEVNPLANTDWEVLLKDEFQKKYFKKLMKYLDNERKTYTIFPQKRKFLLLLNFRPSQKLK